MGKNIHDRNHCPRWGVRTVLFFSPAILLFNTSCSTLSNYAGAVFTPANVVTAAASQVVSASEKPDDFSYIPLPDQTLQSYVRSVGQNLFPLAKTHGLSVVILNTARVQGLSMCDTGVIYFTRGMLNMTADEAELACLIGHEIGHQDLGHCSKMYEENTGQKLLNIGANLAGSEVVSSLSAVQRKIAASGWEQDKEQAADEYGAVLAAKAGYDPYALCDLFDRLLQRVNADALYHAGSLVASHKTLDERAAHLRQYLKDLGYQPGKGTAGKKEFQTAMAGLSAIHTGEGGEDEFERIAGAAQPYLTAAKPMPAQEFVEMMNRFSALYQKRKSDFSMEADESGLVPAADPQFMSEPVYQDSPFSGGYIPKDYEKRIKDALAHLVVGGVPVVGNVVSFGEGLTGKNFYTHGDLSLSDRQLSLIGGVAVQTGQNVALDFAAGAAGNVTTVQSYGDSLASIAKDLGADIDQNVNDSIQSAGGVLDRGKNWSRVDDGTVPPWKGVYRMETTSDQTYFQVTTQDGEILLDHYPSASDSIGGILDVKKVPVYQGSILRAFEKFGVIAYKK